MKTIKDDVNTLIHQKFLLSLSRHGWWWTWTWGIRSEGEARALTVIIAPTEKLI